MALDKCALILIGFQNDYFAEDGILRGAIEESAQTNQVLKHSLELVDKVKDTGLPMIQTPIIFAEDYKELVDPVGILKTIKDVGAFKTGTGGAEILQQFLEYGDRIKTIPGKRGLNAFSNTDLETYLRNSDVEEVVLAGTVTSICIDSTGRSAHEKGFRVTILSDCTASRTNFEQNFYCENIFPLYANVITSDELLA